MAGRDPRRSVLYIDDNPVNVLLLERFLRQRADIVMASASTGGAGLTAIREDPPDLLFLDLHLPDMSGNDVLAAVRDDPATARTPVVIVTADLDPDVPGAHADPHTCVLPKPLDVDRVLAVVDTPPSA